MEKIDNLVRALAWRIMALWHHGIGSFVLFAAASGAALAFAHVAYIASRSSILRAEFAHRYVNARDALTLDPTARRLEAIPFMLFCGDGFECARRGSSDGGPKRSVLVERCIDDLEASYVRSQRSPTLLPAAARQRIHPIRECLFSGPHERQSLTNIRTGDDADSVWQSCSIGQLACERVNTRERSLCRSSNGAGFRYRPRTSLTVARSIFSPRAAAPHVAGELYTIDPRDRIDTAWRLAATSCLELAMGSDLDRGDVTLDGFTQAYVYSADGVERTWPLQERTSRIAAAVATQVAASYDPLHLREGMTTVSAVYIDANGHGFVRTRCRRIDAQLPGAPYAYCEDEPVAQSEVIQHLRTAPALAALEWSIVTATTEGTERPAMCPTHGASITQPWCDVIDARIPPDVIEPVAREIAAEGRGREPFAFRRIELASRDNLWVAPLSASTSREGRRAWLVARFIPSFGDLDVLGAVLCTLFGLLALFLLLHGRWTIRDESDCNWYLRKGLGAFVLIGPGAKIFAANDPAMTLLGHRLPVLGNDDFSLERALPLSSIVDVLTAIVEPGDAPADEASVAGASAWKELERDRREMNSRRWKLRLHGFPHVELVAETRFWHRRRGEVYLGLSLRAMEVEHAE